MGNYDLKELEAIEFQLSEEDEQMLAEVAELSKNMPKDKDLLSDLIDASIKGSMNYVDSFIDITEIGDYHKNMKSMRDNDNKVITPKQKSDANRTMKDARYSPYQDNSPQNHSGMSETGRKRLKQYEKEYRNRVKTIENNKGSWKADSMNSMQSLSGLESYRLGPKVATYSLEEYKKMYLD